jgi:magnesium transporter
MGYYRDGHEVWLPGLSDAIYDAPSVAPARDAMLDLHARSVSDDGFTWVGLFQPTKAELAAASQVFSLDAHQVEDAGNSHQRAKVDLGGTTAFVVLKVLSYVTDTRQVEVGQVAVFIGPRYVVTVRHGSTRDVRLLRDRVASQPHLLAHGPLGILHAVVDEVVDGYLRVGEQIQASVDQLEETVFSPRRVDLSGSIYLLKRENSEIRRAVGPLLPTAAAMAREAVDEVPDALKAGFRDVGEHVLRVSDQVESVDSLLLALMAAANAKVDLQQSADQRRMAAWAALALVPTVVASLYGMNFVFMPELQWRWGYPAVLLVVATVLVMLYRRFRRDGWL